MSEAFKDKNTFNADISRWNTSKVTNMRYMFYKASAFNQPLAGWDTSKVTSMNFTFYGASAFNQSLAGWNTSKVTDMRNMFFYTSAFNQPLTGWDTSQVTDMRHMFYGASAFNQPLAGWDTSKVTNMGYMFDRASAFNQDITSWSTPSVSSSTSPNMFSSATAWLAKFERVDQSTSTAGPPSSWRVKAPPAPTLSSPYGLAANWGGEYVGTPTYGMMKVRSNSVEETSTSVTLWWPIVYLGGTNLGDGWWKLHAGCGNKNGQNGCDSICRLFGWVINTSWTVPCGSDYPSGVSTWTGNCMYQGTKSSSGYTDYTQYGCGNPMNQCTCDKTGGSITNTPCSGTTTFTMEPFAGTTITSVLFRYTTGGAVGCATGSCFAGSCTPDTSAPFTSRAWSCGNTQYTICAEVVIGGVTTMLSRQAM